MSRLKPPERLPKAKGPRVRAWQVMLALMLALLGVVVTILALGGAEAGGDALGP